MKAIEEESEIEMDELLMFLGEIWLELEPADESETMEGSPLF